MNLSHNKSRRRTGLRRLLYATYYSWQGLQAAWQNEEAFRLEACLLLLVIPLALYYGDTPVERTLMIGSWMLVMLAELLNSGIEAIVDRIGPERHELSKRAKDIGSAAVLVALVNVALTWLLLLMS